MNQNSNIRNNWTREEVEKIYSLPMTKLMWTAQNVYQENFSDDVQFCTLLSIKTGGCKEDCAYCPQSARFNTEVKAHPLLDKEYILTQAKNAKEGGSTRFCMGAAWRSPPKKGTQFNDLIEVISKISDMGLEVCTTMGMLDQDQARKLKEAGVYAYNHNIDTAPEYYEKIITTRTYQDRLDTLKNVRDAGMTICCGGIVGMGEEKKHRIGMLEQLANFDPHPESVPINLLVKVKGTPLENAGDLDVFELIRTIATARIIMPKSRVRLSAGRKQMSDEAQAMCFVAGANSIFTGEKLLTTDNPGYDADVKLMDRLGLAIVGDGAPNNSSAALH